MKPKIVYEHYRIPRYLWYYYPDEPQLPKRGKPLPSFPHRYSRSSGFVEDVYFGDEPLSKGGLTRCLITNGNGETLAVGEAWCSMADNFSYARGRAIAYGRAIKTWPQFNEVFGGMNETTP